MSRLSQRVRHTITFILALAVVFSAAPAYAAPAAQTPGGEYTVGDCSQIDRTQLRKAYKDAYQACLRLFWEHVKAKGWADKLTLYISDEPFLTKKHIIDQMKACCDMIHEVDPKIRIYCSTWRHCPN